MGEAMAGGLRLFQLRDKGADEITLQSLLDRLRTDYPGLLIVVNGRPTMAARVNGLHLPERMALPAQWSAATLWGRSVHSVDTAVKAQAEGAHYLVLGTIFDTPCKPGRPGAGLDLVREVCDVTPSPCPCMPSVALTRATCRRCSLQEPMAWLSNGQCSHQSGPTTRSRAYWRGRSHDVHHQEGQHPSQRSQDVVLQRSDASHVRHDVYKSIREWSARRDVTHQRHIAILARSPWRLRGRTVAAQAHLALAQPSDLLLLVLWCGRRLCLRGRHPERVEPTRERVDLMGESGSGLL